MPAQCEMGGQNAAIVFDDADPDGRRRPSPAPRWGTRAEVHRDEPRHRRRIGRPLPRCPRCGGRGLLARRPVRSGTVVGPVISSDARARVQAAAEAARSAGGRLLTGAAPVPPAGWFVAPTLVDGLPPEHRVAQEETFGPFTTVHHAADLDDAVRIANGVRYGLSASLHGSDLPRLLACAERLHTGIVKVNAPTSGVDFYTPFGGEKDSSFGPREQGLEALSFYSSTRTVTFGS